MYSGNFRKEKTVSIGSGVIGFVIKKGSGDDWLSDCQVFKAAFLIAVRQPLGKGGTFMNPEEILYRG